jgi:hypothetical protein
LGTKGYLQRTSKSSRHQKVLGQKARQGKATTEGTTKSKESTTTPGLADRPIDRLTESQEKSNNRTA